MFLVRLRDIAKPYGGLRPFRLRALEVEAGELVVLNGMDRQSAAVLTDLLTGTTLPDGAGVVEVQGKATSALSGHDDWLAFLDGFGIVNDRVVLLDELTVAANLAVPLTLEVTPLAAETRGVVELLGGEVGLSPAVLDEMLSAVSPITRLLVRLGRALAHNPMVLLVEHPTVDLAERSQVEGFFATLRRVVQRRRLAAIVSTSDPRVPNGTATRFLTWVPGSGELTEARGWRRWFS